MLRDSTGNQIGRRLGNLSDLPESVRSQLSKAILLEMQAIDIIRELGGIASISEISVKLRHNNAGKSCQFLSAKLTHAVHKGLLKRFKYGIYTIPEYEAVGNLSGLPERLLQYSKTALLETLIIDIIRELGGIASISEISVKLRQKNAGKSRQFLSVKLAHAVHKKLLKTFKHGGRNIYTLPEYEEPLTGVTRTFVKYFATHLPLTF